MPLTNYEGYWSEDMVAFYYESGAWGVSAKGGTIWLGKEADVIKEHPVTVRTQRGMRQLEHGREGKL